MLKFDGPLTNDKFISIVVLSFTRPNHLRHLLESIHEHADMPVEIIVTDDGSHLTQSDRQIFEECRFLCSTLIFNTGVNMGFAASANRGVSLANSDYILVMNDDTLMARPSLQFTKSVLDRPYVGTFGPWGGIKKDPLAPEDMVRVCINGHTLRLSSLPSGSSIFAFRRSLWKELGGFPQVYHNGGDIAFIHKACSHGYFSVRNDLEDSSTLFRNVDVEEEYKNATFTRTPFDSSYPQIFGVPNLKQLHLEREKRIYKLSHAEYEAPYGLHNTESWRSYFSKAKLADQNNYNWSKLVGFGQDRWKNYVEMDLEEIS